ncbi:MAG TPA: hypothetical protein VKA32_04260 [Gammaproteobacteria bacterium]|nr:hypothetical protein [Gammaproteobacteria bacterium]
MRILVVGRDPRTQSLLEGLLCSPLWDVTHCASPDEAARLVEADGEAFDYILVEPDEQGLFDADALPEVADRHGRAPVVYVDWRGDQLPGRSSGGVYGLYPVGLDTEDPLRSADGQWVFEYHAPCRRRSSL